MKRFLLLAIVTLSMNAMAQVVMQYKDDIPGDSLVCVSNWLPRVATLEIGAGAAVAHIADTNLHLATGERQRIAAAITNETDTIALTALATNRVTTLWAASNHWYTVSGRNMTEYWVNVYTGTNVYFSSDFSDITGPVLYPRVLPFPFDDGYSVGEQIEYEGSTLFQVRTGPGGGNGRWWGPASFPSELIPVIQCQGSAFVTTDTLTITNTINYFLLVSTNEFVRPSEIVPESWTSSDHTNWWTNTAPLYVQFTDLIPESWSYANHTNWWDEERLNYVTSSYFSTWRANHINPLLTPDPHPQYAQHSETTNAAIAVAHSDPQWIDYSGRTGLFTITNSFEQPVRVSGTGAAVVAFSGLRDPLPLFCEFSGFSSLHVTNAYQVGGGAYQTNMINKVLVWGSDAHVYVTPITTEDLP